MAFVGEADRGLINLDITDIGPGTYNINQRLGKSQRQGYAPFSSTVPRSQPNSVQNQNNKQVMPGPGQYDLGSQFQNSESFMATNDTSIASMRNSAGKKLYQNVQFKSQSNRFQNAETMIPGPGHYAPRNDVGTMIKKTFRKDPGKTPDAFKGDVMDGFRIINNNRKITSIPSKIVKIDHKETMDAKDLNAVLQSSFCDKEQEYNEEIINEDFTKNAKGGGWSKSTVKRFENKSVGGSKGIGPGKYNITYNPQNRAKANQSSSFASESVRSYYDQMIYNTTSELRAAIRKETGYKSSKPGPGQYDIENSKQGINLQTKPIVHQYFGSTQERFENPINIENSLGPGQYYQSTNFIKPQQRDPRVQISFQSTTERDPVIINTANMPGPGAYETNIVKSIKQNIVKKYNQGYKGNFGNNESRFKSHSFCNEVGPGEYNIQQIEPEFKSNDMANFKSTVPRMWAQGRKQETDQKDYDISYGTIANKIEKQKQYIQNLSKIDVVKPGFDSRADRFQKPKIEDNDTQQQHQNYKGLAIVDEQSYNQMQRHNRSKTEIISSNQNILNNQTTKQYNAAFKDQSNRLEYSKAQEGPGPGRYRSLNQWNKRSYNIKYQLRR